MEEENKKIFYEGQHIIHKRISLYYMRENNYSDNIECPYGYRLKFMFYTGLNQGETYNCVFENEVPVECTLDGINLYNGQTLSGYFTPGEVVKEMNLRKKY